MSNLATNASIARSASRLRWAVLGAIAVMASLYVTARFGLQLGAAHIEYRSRVPDPWGSRIGDVSMVLLIVSLWHLTQMLGRIATGELFTAGVIGRFRSFAWWLLILALFGLFAPPASQLLAAGSGTPPRIELKIDLRDVLTVGVTLLLFLLARLLERARGIDEEMREFV